MTTTEPAPAAQRPRRKRGRETVTDMVRSFGLMVAVVALLLLLTPARGLVWPDSRNRMPVADVTTPARGFAALAGTPALVPASVPKGWRANAATVSRSGGAVRLHIGWATPDQRYAGLDEATGTPATLVTAVLGKRGATVVGTRQLAGVQWQQRVSDRGEPALSRQVGAVTVVVTGDLGDGRLAALAASLH